MRYHKAYIVANKEVVKIDPEIHEIKYDVNSKKIVAMMWGLILPNQVFLVINGDKHD